MKERPIIFSAPMVRAILEGSKTQTRRIVNPQPQFDHHSQLCWGTKKDPFAWWITNPQSEIVPHCPYGKPGDQLWVRESWSIDFQQCVDNDDAPAWFGVHVKYESDGKLIWKGADEKSWERYSEQPYDKNRPSIHMPRWASRIQLEIVSVRVERLNDISEEAAIREGVAPLFTDEEKEGHPELQGDSFKNYLWHGHVGKTITGKQADDWDWQYSDYLKAKDSFSSLWESINGKGSWSANPWVWVVEFKRVNP